MRDNNLNSVWNSLHGFIPGWDREAIISWLRLRSPVACSWEHLAALRVRLTECAFFMLMSPNAGEQPWGFIEEVATCVKAWDKSGDAGLPEKRKVTELYGRFKGFSRVIFTVHIVCIDFRIHKMLSEKPDLQVSESYLLSRHWLVLLLTCILQTLGSLKLSPTSWYLNLLFERDYHINNLQDSISTIIFGV